MLTTCAVLTAARTLPEASRPTTPMTFVGVSFLAGAIWPLLLVGVAEFGSVLTYAKLTQL
jgi:hypothetical protein